MKAQSAHFSRGSRLRLFYCGDFAASDTESRLNSLEAKKRIDPNNIDPNNITGVSVDLKIDGAPSLFASLAADGSINRLGTGAASNTETELFRGITDPKLFESVRSQITGDLLRWVGGRVDHKLRGKACELLVAFMLANGEEHAIKFKYGSESVGPPIEVSQFVTTVVEATNPWYDNFKSRTPKQKQ